MTRLTIWKAGGTGTVTENSLKPKIKLELIQSSHHGFYEWIVVRGYGSYKGVGVTPGSHFSIPKVRFWRDGFK
jgi:hypothetical protein